MFAKHFNGLRIVNWCIEIVINKGDNINLKYSFELVKFPESELDYYSIVPSFIAGSTIRNKLEG